MFYKHLLVAVDGSKVSIESLEHAVDIANIIGSKITLINVVNPTEYMALSTDFLQHDSYEEAAIAQSNEILDKAEKIAKDKGIKNVARYIAVSTKGAKDMAQQVVDYAKNNDVDLIVLGTHGRTGLSHLLMGSFAETIMRQTTLPLLILRAQSS